MRSKVPVILWGLVGVAFLLFLVTRDTESPKVEQKPDGAEQAGIVLVDVPWEHLPDVDRFQLVDQNGDSFDSGKLVGKPYVVSFFFATCPSFCMDLNKQLERLNSAVKNTDVQFLTVTVDPERDTVEVLKKYAEGFNATPDRWAFLTGQMYQLKEFGEHNFNVPIDPATHTDNILLIDKWGKYRDRFKWDQPYDMKRFIKVLKEVAAETEPPFNSTVTTRNAMAGLEPVDLNAIPWLHEFHLTERSGEKFFSRQLTGDVWIGNFFFTTCPGICKKQNEYLRGLQTKLGDESPTIVSITTNAATDTPLVLKKYAEDLGVEDEDPWLFLTGNSLLIERIGSEFFKAASGGDHHSSLLYVVDRWGNVRGSFDWQIPEQEVAMLALVKELKNEKTPPGLMNSGDRNSVRQAETKE